MKLISKDMSERKEIEKITQVNGWIRRSQEVEDDEIQPCHDTHFNSTMNSPRKNRTWKPKPATSNITGLPNVEERVDKLVLSDDDIEDD